MEKHITAPITNASSITIKVGKKEFKFTATGLTNN